MITVNRAGLQLLIDRDKLSGTAKEEAIAALRMRSNCSPHSRAMSLLWVISRRARLWQSRPRFTPESCRGCPLLLHNRCFAPEWNSELFRCLKTTIDTKNARGPREEIFHKVV